MSKRKVVVKKRVGGTGGNSIGRVIIGNRMSQSQRELLNPSPSAEALERIERLENSFQRSAQRLGQIRLT